MAAHTAFSGERAQAEVEGPAVALASLADITADRWLPLPAARADLLSRLGRHAEARVEYDRALALSPRPGGGAVSDSPPGPPRGSPLPQGHEDPLSLRERA